MSGSHLHFDYEERPTEGESGNRRFVILLADDCRYFDGHFPGHPVLSAVAQLDLLVRLIRRLGHPTAFATGADKLRFQQPVVPGAEIEVWVDGVDAGRPTAFRFTRGAVTLSRGVLAWSVES